jgi:hypothetical protein
VTVSIAATGNTTQNGNRIIRIWKRCPNSNEEMETGMVRSLGGK